MGFDLVVHILISSISIPIMLNGPAYIPPATSANYVPWTIVGFVFQYVIRRRHFGWWSKYNCTHALFRLL